MKLHEYQSKEILAKYGVSIPTGEVARTPINAKRIAARIGKKVVIKAQVHAGGRGSGGGIKMARDPVEAVKVARKIINMNLITPQTGAEGRLVRKVLVEKGVNIIKELYIGVVIDRTRGQPVMMASECGGMDIEKVARETPEKILKVFVDPIVGLQPFQVRKLAFGLNLDKIYTGRVSKAISAIYRVFEEEDCSLAEINPLVITEGGEVIALDAKLDLDDNALFRHAENQERLDIEDEEPLEIEADRCDVSYIKLKGNIGCMVNGAGLAMATMDIIQMAGGMPANFLDVGGRANTETIANGFKIILKDSGVRAILINIFGGIMRCDRVAQGIVDAADEVNVGIPVVIRLEGTNADKADEILKKSSLNFITARDIGEAARKIVEVAK